MHGTRTLRHNHDVSISIHILNIYNISALKTKRKTKKNYSCFVFVLL